LSSKVLFSQLCVFVFHCGTNGGINQSIPLYDLVFMESRKKAPYLMPINVECLSVCCRTLCRSVVVYLPWYLAEKVARV
jgi:hypothetical protein